MHNRGDRVSGSLSVGGYRENFPARAIIGATTQSIFFGIQKVTGGRGFASRLALESHFAFAINHVQLGIAVSPLLGMQEQASCTSMADSSLVCEW